MLRLFCIVLYTALILGANTAQADRAAAEAVLAGDMRKLVFLAEPKPLPEAALVDLADAPRGLEEWRGRWVVVNFWATWCAPCLKEMPELSALDAMREHVEVVGLAYEDIEPDAMRAFLEKHPVVYPVAILDVYDPPADFATPRGLPMTYLIAPDGKVAKKFLGPITATEIEAAIAAAGGPEAPQA